MNVRLYLGDVLPVRDALQHFYDLKCVRPELLKLLQRHTSMDATSHSKQTLDDLLSDGVSILAFLVIYMLNLWKNYE